MTTVASERVLREILHPIACSVFQKLDEMGYAFNIKGTYRDDFEIAFYENWKQPGHGAANKLLYGVIDKATGKLRKIGMTGNLDFRQLDYDLEECSIVPFVDFHRLDECTESFLQKKYRELVANIRANDQVPDQVKKLFDVIVERGGEELGVKGLMIVLMAEVGAQRHYGVSTPAELLMFDRVVYQEREKYVAMTVERMMSVVSSALDLDERVSIVCVSSCPTADDKEAKFGNIQSFMDYMTGSIQDLEETDTIPVAAVPVARTEAEAFSDDYSKVQREQGVERLRNFVRSLPDNSFMLLNTNRVLNTDVQHMLETEYLYDSRLDVWDEECILLTHAKVKKVIALHRPPGYAGDSRNKIAIWKSIKRCMLLEVLKRVASDRLVPEADREIKSFHADFIFGSYVFEFMRNGVHHNKKVAAAALRDAVTPSSSMPLRDNGLAKTVSDPDYPITSGLRKKYNSDNEVARPQFPLSIQRATIKLSMLMDARDPVQVAAAVTEAEKILCEDDPTKDTLRYRWTQVLSRIDSESPLRQAIDDVRDASKVNRGNTDARGHTTGEREEFELEFHRLTSLPFGTPFYVRVTAHDLPFPANAPVVEHSIFTEGGLIGRLQEKRNPKGNTSVEKASRSDIPLKLIRVLGSDGRSQFIGTKEDGKPLFVLCHILETSRNVKELKENQMQAIEATPIGAMFWLRFDNKSSSEAPFSEVSSHPLYKFPVFNSVRDRLKAKKKVLGKSINKVMIGNRPKKSDCGLFVLCKIVAV